MSSKSTFEQSLRTAAQNLTNESVPETLSARVMNALPNKAPARPATKWIPRLAVVGALAGVAIVGGYFLPRTVMTTSYAAEMKQAIANARTWHFSGWRLVKGQQVRWEVWGRRSPFLYREQIGGELLIDDGKKRVHILPPDDYTKSPGTCLITPSEPLRSLRTGSVMETHATAGYLAGIGSEDNRFGTFETMPGHSSELMAETKETFGTNPPIRERTTLFVDSKTLLPTRYSVVQETYPNYPIGTGKTIEEMPLNGKPLSVQAMSELSAEYDVPVSDSIAQYASPAGYKVIDATKQLDGQALDGTVCTRKGLTLKAHVVGKDSEGNIHLRFEGWIGGEPLRYRPQALGLMITMEHGHKTSVTDTTVPREYLETWQPPWVSTNVEHPELWITPSEPFSKNEMPRTLHLVVDADLSRYERVSNTGRNVPVLSDRFEFDIPLPHEVVALGWDEAPDSNGMTYTGVRPSYLLRKAEVRAEYYMTRTHSTTFTYSDGRQEVVSDGEANKRRAEYWFGIVEQEAKRTHNTQILNLTKKNRESLELIYKKY